VHDLISRYRKCYF